MVQGGWVYNPGEAGCEGVHYFSGHRSCTTGAGPSCKGRDRWATWEPGGPVRYDRGRRHLAQRLLRAGGGRPVDLLHICSHAGEVPGEYCSLQLTDEENKTHTLEFDVVVSFYPAKYYRQAPQHTKFFWRVYNGLPWNSPEFWAAGGIDGDLFARFRQLGEEKSNLGILKGIQVKNVQNSSCVICYDFPFLGMIDAVAAARMFPFVFNNSCWSGFEIAGAFIDAGTRAYIGTLWNVDNEVATGVAKAFYETVYDIGIARALQLASRKGSGTDSDQIYIFWGLHFSTLKTGQDIEKSKNAVIHYLGSSHKWLVDNAQNHPNYNVRQYSLAKAMWIMRYMKENFLEDMFRMKAEGRL